MFLPTTPKEMHSYQWDSLDIILITGDAYIDSPNMGVAVIGHVLVDAGFSVGIIGQPDVNGATDILRLGEPTLFWGVTSGSVDSMVANFTASKKPRRSDDFTPGGKQTKRPNRAVIRYTNLIRQHSKLKKPIVLGGLEASLRRAAHYDFWDDSIRRPILLDAKADFLIYGMGEKAVVDLAACLSRGDNPKDVKGLCYLASQSNDEYLALPSYEAVQNDALAFAEMYRLFYAHTDPMSSKGLVQQVGTRFVIQNPPADALTIEALDRIYELPYERNVHPYYLKDGPVPAIETIRFSVTTHRGCFGSCRFCAITAHQGKKMVSRSQDSVVREIKTMHQHPKFSGKIDNLGGPTANMYGMGCELDKKKKPCSKASCMAPTVCRNVSMDHQRYLELLKQVRSIPGIKKVFVRSGIRYDLLISDKEYGKAVLHDILKYHSSGQIKIAPEHTDDYVLSMMGKSVNQDLVAFNQWFGEINKSLVKQQYLTYYMMAAHPGCTLEHMKQLKSIMNQRLEITPEQVQIFTPLPSTYSALMYHTETDPFTQEPIFVEKTFAGRQAQKDVLKPS